VAPHRIVVEATGPVRHVHLSGAPLGAVEAAELRDLAEALREDRDVRVVVVDSAGADFCPGAGDDLEPLAVSPDPAPSSRIAMASSSASLCRTASASVRSTISARVGIPLTGFPSPSRGRRSISSTVLA